MADTNVRSATRFATRASDWLAARVGERIAIDLRALAALRVALGSLVLADLLLRARNLEVFYTDDGVFPRLYLNDPLAEPYSVHAFSGSIEFQALLFVVAGLFAISLLLGYRTRTATVVSWFLLLSLQHRNPIVLNSGDSLLRLLLFWGILLPLGERWSVDARRIDRERTVTASLATLAVMVQVVLVYGVNAIHKLKSEEWVYGNAAGTVMQLDQFTVFLGPYLAEYALLLWAFTRLWVVLMVVSPLLLVLTGWRRGLLATAFVGMHLGMAATMQIGLFPLISVAGLLVFYPPTAWDRLDRTIGASELGERLGGLLDRLHRLDPLTTLRPASSPLPRRVRTAGVTARTVFLVLLIPLVIVSGVASAGYGDTPDRGATLLDHTNTDQNWRMFAPNPLDTSRWYAAEGVTTDGRTVDPFLGGTPQFDEPPNAADTVRTARWRKYLSHVKDMGPTERPDYFGNYLCNSWNESHDADLQNVSVYVYERDVDEHGPVSEPQRDVVVREYDCTGDLYQA